MPSSRPRRAAAWSKRMAAEVQGLVSSSISGVVATIYTSGSIMLQAIADIFVRFFEIGWLRRKELLVFYRTFMSGFDAIPENLFVAAHLISTLYKTIMPYGALENGSQR
jgi:hypothetical protein